MLDEKIKYLMNELNVDGKTLASYAGVAPAGISRMRNGSRSYDRSSITVKKLVNGLWLYAADKGLVEKLCLLVGSLSENGEDLKKELTEWLFDDKKVMAGNTSSVDPEVFGRKLTDLMKLAGVTNSRLGRDLNIDSSYISRMKNGRVPQRNYSLMMRMCENITVRISENGRKKELSRLIDLPAEYLSDNDAPEHIFKWLYDSSTVGGVNAVKSLIESIESFPEQIRTELPSFAEVAAEDILDERVQNYEGLEGLKRAVVRFLGNAVRQGSRELLLYSEITMDWLNSEFRHKWAALMNECMKRGVTIRIIHNVDRSSAEMMTAINNWLPFYMSGRIEPYYCLKKRGERFSHTLFLDPDRACIESSCVSGCEGSADYDYHTSEKKLRKMREYFDMLLSMSRPLVKICNDYSVADGNYSVSTYGEVQICIGDSSVVVNKLSVPQASFTFTHPFMCRAFRSFVEMLN
ncbi:MAG: helix-turn-helix domain-containing protein [Ruminococcus sp.]|nr:helix-turn-helix domain-containing protein [Ruminococcus sp.]